MMNQEVEYETVKPAPPIGTMLLAVAAPFAAIAILAMPLAFDALKHAAGF
jgi:hypothetical protein